MTTQSPLPYTPPNEEPVPAKKPGIGNWRESLMEQRRFWTWMLLAITGLSGCAAPEVARRPASPAVVKASAPVNEHLRLNDLGNAAIAKKEYDQAVKYYRDALAYAPNDAVIWGNLGGAYGGAGNHGEAMKALDKSLDLNPKHDYALRVKGSLFLSQGKYDEAIKHYSRAVEEIKPDNRNALSDALLGRAKASYMVGKYAEALSDFKGSFEAADVGNTTFRQGLCGWIAWTHYYRGEFSEAILEANRVFGYSGSADHAGNVMSAYTCKAFSYLGLGDGETALAMIQKAKESNPQYNPDAELAAIYYILGDKERAWRYRGGGGMVGAEVRGYRQGAVSGAEVVRATPGGPAEQARLLAGDVVIRVNGTDVGKVEDFMAAARKLTPGATSRVTILREGTERVVHLRAASAEPLMEADPRVALLLGKRKGGQEIRTAKLSAPEAPLQGSLPPLRTDAHALVIGIDYAGRTDIPVLQYAAADARKVYDVLTDARYGGIPRENAVLLLNDKATRNGMKSALRRIRNESGYLYIYYSGHGAPKTRGEKLADAFLVPFDADITSPEALDDTGIRISEIEDLMEGGAAKGIVMALDACFTGGGKSVIPKGGKPLVGMLATEGLIKPKGARMAVLTSSAANQQSWEDDGEIKGGIFSHFLLEGLRGAADADADSWINVGELSNYLKTHVLQTARRLKNSDQTPQLIGAGNVAVAKNWERARVMDVDIARASLKAAFERGAVTPEQLNKAMDEIRSSRRSKTLDAFLGGKIDERKFGELY